MSSDGGGQILIDGLTWRRLIAGLAVRGGATRESGAFLLGPGQGPAKKVTRVVFYDDLDARCLTGGSPSLGRATPNCGSCAERLASWFWRTYIPILRIGSGRAGSTPQTR